jgi:hypothetical protein
MFIQVALPIVLAGIAALAHHYVKDQQASDAIVTAAANAANWGLARVPGALPGKPLDVDVASPVLAEALKYMIAHVPQSISRMGLDEKALVRMITAKLPGINQSLDDHTIEEVISLAVPTAGKPPAVDYDAIVGALAPVVQDLITRQLSAASSPSASFAAHLHDKGASAPTARK